MVGDSVLTIKANNELVFSPIILDLHRSPKDTNKFLILRTNSGHSLTLSPQHLVYRKQKNMDTNDNKETTNIQSFRPVFASDVIIGDSVLVHDRHTGVKLAVVINVEEIMLTGVYSPLTSEGNIVVDDILASCYSDFDNHELQHLAFAPFRWMYSLLQFTSTANLKPPHTDGSMNPEDDNVHWYGQGLHVLSEILFPSKLWDSALQCRLLKDICIKYI